jgi:hypothetical protein
VIDAARWESSSCFSGASACVSFVQNLLDFLGLRLLYRLPYSHTSPIPMPTTEAMRLLVAAVLIAAYLAPTASFVTQYSCQPTFFSRRARGLAATCSASIGERDPGIAVITGGNRGIGFEICNQLASQGYRIVLAARQRGKGETAAGVIRACGAQCDFYQLDVSSERSVENFAQQLKDDGLNDISCVINNAAIGMKYEAFSAGSVRKVFETNCYGALRLTRALLPSLRSDARVVFVSSRSGADLFVFQIWRSFSPYSS